MAMHDDRGAGPSYGASMLMVLSSGIIWSLMGLGVRLIENADSFQILLYRSIAILPCLLVFLGISHRTSPLRVLANAGIPSIIGGLCLMVAFFGSIVSLKETTIANAVFLLATSPLFAAVLGRIILKEPVRLATWLTILAGGIGVLVMVADGISAGRMIGNLAAVICALAFAGFTIALRWERTGSALPAVFYGGLFATVASAVATIVAGQTLVLSPLDAGIALGLGFFIVSGGLIVYTLGSRAIPAAELALLSLIEVVLSPIWVWLVPGEAASFFTLVGGSILLAALAGNALSGVLEQRHSRQLARKAQAARRRPKSRPAALRPAEGY